jgi:hypothetical protein
MAMARVQTRTAIFCGSRHRANAAFLCDFFPETIFRSSMDHHAAGDRSSLLIVNSRKTRVRILCDRHEKILLVGARSSAQLQGQ